LKGYILEKGRKEFKIIKIITAMKKSIFVLLASICIALFFAMNVSINLSKDQSKSGLALKNIEALARGETPGGDKSKPKGTYGCTPRAGFTAYKIYDDAGCKCSKWPNYYPASEVCTCSNY